MFITFLLLSCVFYTINSQCHPTCATCKKDGDPDWCRSCNAGEIFTPHPDFPDLVVWETTGATKLLLTPEPAYWKTEKSLEAIPGTVGWFEISININHYTVGTDPNVMAVGICGGSQNENSFLGNGAYGWGYFASGKIVHDSQIDTAPDYCSGRTWKGETYTITISVNRDTQELFFWWFVAPPGTQAQCEVYEDPAYAPKTWPLHEADNPWYICASWRTESVEFEISTTQKTIGSCRCPAGQGRIGTGSCVVCEDQVSVPGYYRSGQTCVECSQWCSACTSTECTTCGNGKFLKGGVCVTSCGDGYYESGGECFTCADSHCKTCSGGGATACQVCLTNYWQLDGICSVSCEVGQYKGTGVCEDCADSNCEICTGPGDTCTKCTPGAVWYAKDGVCVRSCFDGYWGDGGVCHECMVRCRQCNGVTDQSSCTYACYDPWANLDGACVDDCGDYHWEQNNMCYDCTDTTNCKTCTDSSSGDACVECEPGDTHFALAGLCTTDCGDGYFAAAGVCQACSVDDCFACTTAVDTCDECSRDPELYLKENSCVGDCGDGWWTYTIQRPYECYECFDSRCKTCTNSLSNGCTECASPYVMNSYTGLCEEECPSGEFWTSPDGPCTTCPWSGFCVECVDNNVCTECITGYFPNTVGDTTSCASCGANCDVCTTQSECSQCADGYVWHNNNCPSSCPSGYARVGGVCEECGTHCAICSSPTDCTLCSPGFVKTDGNCIDPHATDDDNDNDDSSAADDDDDDEDGTATDDVNPNAIIGLYVGLPAGIVGFVMAIIVGISFLISIFFCVRGIKKNRQGVQKLEDYALEDADAAGTQAVDDEPEKL